MGVLAHIRQRGNVRSALDVCVARLGSDMDSPV
jgi:hypothetical protein